MMTKSFVALVASFILFSSAFSQTDFKSEEELKSKAEKLFAERKLAEASPLYAQLLSLYPQDPNYNYRYGATLLEASADREKPMKYLKFALSKSSQVEPLAYYFLGKAHHLNYNFADAVKYYSRFKQKGDKELIEEFMVDRQIEMAKNGNKLLSKLNEVQVLDKQTISRKDFFRIYELEGINGKIIVKPEEFMTKYDQKVGEKSVIYLPANATEVYFSSYGKKGENGRDIFKTVKLGNRSWSEPVNLGPSINTPYDENYPFIHPDGRTLYFASKGHSSMGGYDLFMSTYDQSTASWKAPVNLDFAFSSVDDDILFVTDQNQVLAYFASSRANEADEITVYKVLVEKAPAELSVIQGKFIAESNPDLKKAKITVIDSKTQQTIGVYETSKEGNYKIEIPTNGGLYRFNLETTPQDPIHTGEVEIPRQDVFAVLGQELRLVGEGESQQLVIKNIFDGTIAQNTTGLSVSSATLRQKALLDINFSADALAEIERRRQQESAGTQSSSSSTSQDQGSSQSDQLADNQEVSGSSNDDQSQTSRSSDPATSNEGGTTGSSSDPNTTTSGSIPPAGGGVVPAAVGGGVVAGVDGIKGSEQSSEDLSPEAQTAALKEKANGLEASISNRASQLKQRSDLAYQKALELKSEADLAFEQAGIDPNSPNRFYPPSSASSSSSTSSNAATEDPSNTTDGNRTTDQSSDLEEGEGSSTSKQAQDASTKGGQNDQTNIEDQSGSKSTSEQGPQPSSAGTESEDILKARRLASRAAIGAALAQKLEVGAKRINEIDQDFRSNRASIDQNIQNSEFTQADERLDQVENDLKAVRTAAEYIDRYKADLSSTISREKTSLVAERSKFNDLKSEDERIRSSIASLNEVIGEGEPTEEQAKQLEELQLDQDDIRFQLRTVERKIASKERQIAALELEREEVGSLEQEFAQLDQSSTTPTELASAEKQELISGLKNYRDNNQLAYSTPDQQSNEYLSPAELYEGREFAEKNSLIADASSTSASTSSSSSSSTSLEGVEAKSIASLSQSYSSQLGSANSLPDQDLQNARKIEIYDNWLEELEQQQALRRNQVLAATGSEEKQRLQEEINSLSIEISQRSNEREAIRTEISGRETLASKSPQDGSQAPGKESTSGTTTSIDPTSNQQQAASAVAAGAVTTSTSSDETSKISADLAEDLGPVDLSSVQANSPYPSGLNTFSYDKNYQYSSNEATPSLKAVKTALYQAKEYSNKADAARAAAYTLPTVEERRQAFEDVNEYEKAAETLQIQAMKDLSVVNQQEFYRNANILNNLNDYDETEIESSNLDIALLLQEEAETYFGNAQVMRAEAQEMANSGRSERLKLQKAYDMEMLALNKQRQAFEALKLVDADIESAALSEAQGSSQYKNAQIQTITNPTVLAIEDAAEAKLAGDSINAKAASLEESAEQLRKSAEVETVGPKRDSLMAVYKERQDSAVQLRSLAAVYYEREEQIESGFVAEVPADAGIMKPALVFTQSYDLDTINVDDERKNVILESQEYKAFSAGARENLQLRMAARVEYDKAVELRKKQFELDRQAQVILASAAQTDDPSEKERRVKQAQVIDMKARRLDDSIDSLNKIIKVKNYLVSSSSDRMKQSIASLSAVQQAEIIYLVNQEVDITSTDLVYDEVAMAEIRERSDQAALASQSSPEIASPKTSEPSTTTATSVPVVTTDIRTESQSESATSTQQAEDQIADTPTSTQEETNSTIEETPSSTTSTPPSRRSSNEEVLNDGTVNPEKVIRTAPRRPASLANIDKVPRSIDQPIFIKLGLNESAYNSGNPIPTMDEMPTGIIYKVQVGAFRNPVPQDLFKGFAPLSSERAANGITRYTAGLFTNEREAISARDEIRDFGYRDAFVVAFKDGKRISITAARQGGSTSADQIVSESSTSAGSIEPGRSSGTPTQPNNFGSDVKDLQSIDELFFSVQIGVYSKEVKAGTFDSYKDLNAIKLNSGLIRYNSGIFKSAEEANAYKDQIVSNIPDAFVVVYYKGRRISINEAARIMNQN